MSKNSICSYMDFIVAVYTFGNRVTHEQATPAPPSDNTRGVKCGV